MDKIILFGVVALVLFLLYRWNKRALRTRRKRLIDSYRFPDRLKKKLLEAYPHLSDAQANLVIKGLREYFHLCNMAGKRMVAMPSQVVDLAWHEFILFTRQYQHFCSKALGRFLHHTPAEAMVSPVSAQEGIKRAWRLACQRESIKAKTPARLPLLFALDAQLQIPKGFVYTLDCKNQAAMRNGAVAGASSYCASHISCGSGCGGGCVGDSHDSGCGSDCGGGCGGD